MSSAPVDLTICVTCQRATTPAGADSLGKHFYRRVEEALTTHGPKAPVRLHQVECMCVCQNACNVAVSTPGKWTYMIGKLESKDIHDLFKYLDAYAANEHGVPNFFERPECIRKGTLARLPPQLNTGDTPPTQYKDIGPLASRRPSDGDNPSE